jgi:hypothetical protein
MQRADKNVNLAVRNQTKMPSKRKQPVMVGQYDRKWALERQQRKQQQGLTLGELQQRQWDTIAARSRIGARPQTITTLGSLQRMGGR